MAVNSLCLFCRELWSVIVAFSCHILLASGMKTIAYQKTFFLPIPHMSFLEKHIPISGIHMESVTLRHKKC